MFFIVSNVLKRFTFCNTDTMNLLRKTTPSLFELVIVVSALFLPQGTSNSNNGKDGGEERIAGGKIAPDGKYPALARIEKNIGTGSENWIRRGCASILNRDWLLTAASVFSTHPYTYQNLSRFRVIVGDSIRNQTEPYEQTLHIQRIILHERYHGGRASNNRLTEDIAVIKLTTQIKFSNRVTSVNLPSCKERATGTAWIAGWGSGRPMGNMSAPEHNQMMEIDTEINTNQKCNQRLKEVGRPYINLTDSYLCTNETNGKGACYGDYGCPLFSIKNEYNMVQIGIWSFRPAYQFHCGEHNQVAVYIRVSKYVGWIHRRISGCGNHPFHNATETDD